MPRTGPLRERITLQVEAQGQDDQGGGYPHLWVDVPDTPDVWARVTPTGGGPATIPGGVLTQTTYEVEVRWRSDINGSMRVMWRDKAMRIEAVLPGERSDRLLLQCTGGAPT